MSLNASLDLGPLFKQLDAFSGEVEAAARPAAQAATQEFYDEVRARVPVSAKVHATRGKKQVYSPGNLKAAIYQAFDENDSGKGSAVYRVSWNKKKAFYGRFVEFGTARMAAKPFLRPAFDAAKGRANEAAQKVLIERIKARRA